MTPDDGPRWTTCPECGQTGGCPADEWTPRWEDDKVRERLGFPTEGRCPNCGSLISTVGRPLTLPETSQSGRAQ
jgi:hypothetical protein